MPAPEAIRPLRPRRPWLGRVPSLGVLVLKSTSIPGGTLVKGNLLRVEARARRTGGAGSWGLTLRYGGTDLVAHGNVADATQFLCAVVDAPSTTAQRAYSDRNGDRLTGTGAEDAQVTKDLALVATKAVGGDAVTCDHWVVERVAP